MARSAVRFRRTSQSEFAKVFRSITDRHSSWQVWADFVVLAAISIAAPFGVPDDERHREREKEYRDIMERYQPEERKVFPVLFAMTVDALEEEPHQDFLGEMFMALELSNHWKGQFFTPYDLCRCMAEITMTDIEARIQEKGWFGIMDPACGAGALLIAARNQMHFANPPIGYLPGHLHALFVCQDIDRVAALMCYIQLSLLGCAGYVVVGNSITNPITGYGDSLILPVEREGQEIWCMPMFHDKVWVLRQTLAKLNALTEPLSRRAIPEPAPQEKPPESPPKRPAKAPKLPPPEETAGLNITETGQLTMF